MYNQLKDKKSSGNFSSHQIESIIMQEAELEKSKLYQDISALHKENRDWIKKYTETKNEYESMVQQCNIAKDQIVFKDNEVIDLTKKIDSLYESLSQSEKRIFQLTEERNKLNMKLKDMEISHLEAKYKEAMDEKYASIQAENEMFKKMVADGSYGASLTIHDSIEDYKKREGELLKEIESYKQKLINYKHMLREFEILLTLSKNHNSSANNQEHLHQAVDLDSLAIEDLMLTVKEHINSCVYQIKRSLAQSRVTSSISESTEQNYEARVNELNTEKEGLLRCISDLENNYKNRIETGTAELQKIKILLKGAIEEK